MPPDKVFQLLRQYGLPVADYEVVQTFNEGRIAAHRIGYPVAVKVSSPLILHKTESGGVTLNITSDMSLKEAFDATGVPSVMIQKMAHFGSELIVGGKRDPAFGPVIIFGMGGIYAELLRDVSVRMVPVDERSAMKMMDEIQGSAILRGYRGKPPCDLQAVARCIAGLSRLLADHHEVVNLDVNPLIAYEKDKGCIIVDAKIEALLLK